MIIGRMKYRLEDLLTTKGDIAYRATAVAARLAAGTDGKYLKMASGIPSWAYAFLIGLLTADGDIAIRSSGAPAALHKGSDGEVLTLVSGLPAWAASEVATVKVKPDDQIVNNSTTLVNDEDLVLAVGANDVWVVHMVLFHIAGTGEPDMDYAFAVPSGGAVRVMETWERALSDTSPPDFGDGTSEMITGVADTEKYVQITFVYIGGGTAGNLQLQWAQHQAVAENTTMKAKSFMLCQKIV